MKDKRKVLIFCMILVVNAAFCQFTPIVNVPPRQDGNSTRTVFSGPDGLQGLLPADFYITQLGFFCKKELKFEALTRLPLKFRLGNVGYCDWLEGKKGTGILPMR